MSVYGKFESAEKKYKDIIDLPHPTSRKHPRMSLEARAAQFAPFAALTGHKEELQEERRLTKYKIIQDEGYREDSETNHLVLKDGMEIPLGDIVELEEIEDPTLDNV